ncbi:tetratricopeptide repeat protein [Glaciecola sp. 1036]|uniref:tetratricopeptide repeat protein n=1 Tax=Alteromonadaceae TaxID=72275 RepID=UPI003D087D34
MNFNRVLLVLSLTVGLSGCLFNSMAPPPPAPEQNKPAQVVKETATETEPNVQAPLAGELDPATSATIEMTPEEALVHRLKITPDMYLNNKQILTAPVKTLMVEAIQALADERYEIGLTKFDQASRLGQLNSPSYVLKADLYLALGQTDEAIASLQQALTLNRHNAKAANRLAGILREQGNFEQAHTLYTNAIKSQPAYAVSYRNRGILNDLYLLNKAAALEDYRIYAALLKAQQSESEQDKALDKEIKLVDIWLVDVERQLNSMGGSQ